MRYGTELSSIEMDDTGVTAVVHDADSGESETIRADYLVGADGVTAPSAHGWASPHPGTARCRSMSCSSTSGRHGGNSFPELHDGDGVQVKNDDVDGIFAGRRGRSRHVHHHLLSRRGRDGRPVHTAALPRGAHQGDRRAGRHRHHRGRGVATLRAGGRPIRLRASFLVGDSAHTMPPFKAGGANTAIQSAHNLAWKLAAVLHGTAAPLLATYQAERHPVADSPRASRSPGRRWRCCGRAAMRRNCRPTRSARCSPCSSATGTARPLSFATRCGRRRFGGRFARPSRHSAAARLGSRGSLDA